MKLWNRTYKCENCDLEIDRDYNSAINIYRLGISLCGDDVRPLGQLSEKQEAIISNIWVMGNSHNYWIKKYGLL